MESTHKLRRIFAANLRRIRGPRKQREIASLLGFSTQAYSQWESGSENPTLDTIEKFSSALGVAASEFFTETTQSLNLSLILTPENSRFITALSRISQRKEQDLVNDAVETLMQHLKIRTEAEEARISLSSPLPISGEEAALAAAKALALKSSQKRATDEPSTQGEGPSLAAQKEADDRR